MNHAANDRRYPVGEVDVALWDDLTAVNVRHHFFAAQAVAPMMREAGGGSIINVGSISAHIDLLELSAYITAKAGIEGLTHTLAREFGPWRIRVNCLIPGWVMTEKQLTQWVTPEAEIRSAAASACRTSCIRTMWRGCCCGLPLTTRVPAPRSAGSWTEGGCDESRAGHWCPRRARRGSVLGHRWQPASFR